MSFSEHGTQLSVKPRAYGVPVQSWAQLRASATGASVTAWSGEAHAELDVQHREASGLDRLGLGTSASARGLVKAELSVEDGEVSLVEARDRTRVTLLKP